MGDSDCYLDGGNVREPVPGSYFLHLELAHAGRDDGESVSPPFCSCRFARSNDEVDDQENREDDFSGRFLSHQGEGHSRDLPNLDAGLLGQSSRRDR